MDSGQVWSILLLTAIFVITLVKMLWTYEAHQSDCDITAIT